MGRLILIIVVFFLVLWVARAIGRATRRGERARPPAGPENMVRCAQCGVHLPAGEAIQAEGRHYCCDEHRRQQGG